MNENRNYWAFRLGNKPKLYDDMQAGRLRQGWGWDEGQDLRKLNNGDEDAVDDGAMRNLRMFSEVKKGDIVLVPVPNSVRWHRIAILEATDDWDDGYEYKIDELNDYGHTFPIKYLKEFHRDNEIVHGDIRKTFRCQRRFWSTSLYKEPINQIINMPEDKLGAPTSDEYRLNNIVNTVFSKLFDDNMLEEMLDKIQSHYQGAEWEKVIKIGLERIASSTNSFRVETTPNKKEKEHGTDLFIIFPNPIYPGDEYVIAVQVKDHEGKVTNSGIDQISKASEEYIQKDNAGDRKIIEKMLVTTKARKDINKDVSAYAQKEEVKIIFKEDFNNLLTRIANSFLDLSSNTDS